MQMNKLWLSALMLVCVFTTQDFYPRRITYCQEGWYPDPIVTSVANGDSTSVTYTFYFALEGLDTTTTTVNVQFPSDFSLSGYYSLTATRLEDTTCCYYASRTVSKNLAALTATGPFSLWSNLHGSQPTYLGWNFASIGFGPAIATMTNVVARFKTGLDSTGTTEDTNTKESLILQSSTVEVQLTLSKPVYQGDLFVLTFSSKFDISQVTSVKSVILGKGTSYENSQWTTNKITSDSKNTDGSYNMKYTISGSTITIYSFNNNIDPRSGQPNDKYAVFQIAGVVNPNAKYIKTSLSFTAQTQRYSYSFGSNLIYETKTVSFSDDLKTGSVPSAKCDFSNSGKYGSSYISSKKVAPNMFIFVDFSFTLDHPVLEGGKIVVVLDGLETPSGVGAYTNVYVSKGLTASSSTIGASWDGTDTIKITGYKSTTTPPSVTFTAQVKVVSGDCFKSVTSYADDQTTKIDEKTSITVSSAVSSDSAKFLFGGSTFRWEFYEGGSAGTATSFRVLSTSTFGTLISPTTDATKTDETVVILNTDVTMYTFGSSLFTTDSDHLNYAPSTYRNATSTSNSNGIITIKRENTKKENYLWVNYYISDLQSVNDPQTSYVNSAVPYYPAYPPNMHKYEVCVFQKDPDQSNYKNMNCLFKDVVTATQANDGDQRCIEECFSLKSCANQHQSTWDFLVWHIRVPTKESSNDFETDKLVWTFQIPASDTSNKVVGSFTCDTASNYFPDGTFGLTDGSDYPLSIVTVGSMSSSYDKEPTLSVSNYVGTIEYSALYEPDTGATPNDYWGVFPVKTKTVLVQQTALTCSITFTWTDNTGYSRTILTLGHASAAGSTNNGPMYIWESSNIRDYYYRDKFRMNWQMSDWEFDNGAQQTIIAQQRMLYGMGANSWCLVLLPSHFDYIEGTSEVTSSASGGNLTLLNLWEFNDKQFLLTYHDEDVWPEWTNNIEVSNLEAPYGEQTSVLLDDDGFRLYMACGNEGDEGEASQTWNSLMITPYKKGYEAGTWKETSVVERTIRDFSATFTLEDTHTLGQGCIIQIEWENSYFLPSWIEVDSVQCLAPQTNVNSVSCTLAKDVTSSLVISFRDTLVVKEVSADAEGSEDYAYFLKTANAYGTWSSSKKVYDCRNLNQASDDCGGVDSADFKVTVKDQSSRYVTVNEVSLFPNNLKPTNYDWVYSDVRIIFYVKNQLLYSDKQATTTQKPRIQLTIPSDYTVNSVFDSNDNCYLNFTGTCSVSSTTITVYPSETIKSSTNYMVWLIQAIKAPTKQEAVDAQAWVGQTYFQNLVVDDEKETSKDVNNTMYATLYDAAIAGTNDQTSLRIFPNNRGEYAQYTFRMQWTDNSGQAEPIQGGRQIWIQFPATNYDYFIGDATEWFEGYVDENESPIYYIPCLLSTDAGYMTGVDCVAKRNWLFVTVTQDLADQTVLELQVVGIRNPDTTSDLTFYILVMEADTEEHDDYHCKADQYYSCAYTLKDEPAPMIDFLNATIDYTDTSNALGESDDYEFWFTVFNEGTTVRTITMKPLTGKFILTFPEDYSFHPTLSATDDPNLKAFTAELYRVIFMSDYEGTDPYKSISDGATANYTLNQWGNALQWSSAEEVTFPSNKDDTTFYDYVFTLKSIQNPSYAHMRMDESYDNAYPDDTKLDLSDNLWISYEEYSKKFELAILDQESASNSDSIYYQTRSYGILHHSYLGFFEINPLLYILDSSFEQVTALEATAGLLSDYYYIATGSSKAEATNHPLSFESITVTTSSEVAQFEPDEEDNPQQTLNQFGWRLPFKLAANQEEGGTIKFINWNVLEQKGYESEEDKYAEMADTLVYVYEPDEDTQATAELAVEELKIVNGVTSLPVYVYLSQSPSVDVKITFDLAFDEDENAGTDPAKLNDKDVVTIDPSELQLLTWDELGNFTVKVEDWSFDKGYTFRLYIGYSGTNADSFTDSNKNSIKFTVLEAGTSQKPNVKFDETTLETGTYSFSVQASTDQMGYAQWLVLPEGQAGPETGESLVGWSDDNYKRIRSLQDNTTEEQEEEFEYGEVTDAEANEWEQSINDEKAIHMQEDWLLSEIQVVYDPSQILTYAWDSDEDGSFFWGNLEYVIYTTSWTIDETYSDVASLNFVTDDLPPPEWASATVSGSSQPDSSQTYDIVCSFAKSIGWRCEQLTYSSEWVYETTRRARSLAGTGYEACTQLLADPSGVSTQRPDQILLAAATCSNCAYYFDQYFKATSSGSTYTAVGYNTDSSSGNLKKMSDLSKLVPIANYQDSQPSSNSITLTFSGYEEHYLYSVLLYSAPEADLETITSDQIISGLDYQNKDALQKSALTWPKGPDSSNYEEITTMDLTYSSLKTGTEYSICVVAVNSYTSITDPLTNFDTVDVQKCYTITTDGKPEEDEEICTGCACNNSCSQDDGGYQLYISAILAILALLFA